VLRRLGYFVRMQRLMDRNGLSVSDVMRGTAISEKSLRRMLHCSAPSLYTSVREVIDFLNQRGLGLDASQEFVEEGGADD
jgi:hypothetical protein